MGRSTSLQAWHSTFDAQLATHFVLSPSSLIVSIRPNHIGEVMLLSDCYCIHSRSLGECVGHRIKLTRRYVCDMKVELR